MAGNAWGGVDLGVVVRGRRWTVSSATGLVMVMAGVVTVVGWRRDHTGAGPGEGREAPPDWCSNGLATEEAVYGPPPTLGGE